MSPRDTKTMSMTACLNRIMIRVSNEGYDEESIELLNEDLAYVCNKFEICCEEAVLLSFVLENNSGFSSCDDSDLAEFLGCTNIEFINFKRHLHSLAQKRIVRIGNNKIGESTYRVLNEACSAIVEDRSFSAKSFSGLTTEEIFSEFRNIFKQFRNEEINAEMVLQDINVLIGVNPQSAFVQKVNDCGILKCTPGEQCIFFYLCHQFVNWGTKKIEYKHLIDFVTDKEDKQKFYRNFQAGRHYFQQMSLVTFGDDEGLISKQSAALTEKVKENFFTEVELFGNDIVVRHDDLISHETIKTKELFYNTSEGEQVERLEALLNDEHFRGIQSRLEEMGMRKGFNIILYGGPGTGKTETVMQLARNTCRDIFSIDIAKLKSKWVGDSEKAVKGVFRTYRELCKRSERVPILFFNEADAIFGKRIENVESSVTQMLNSMQNIILQEMESLEGIMVATTNLHGNLDPAFERRFIYKIKLRNPDSSVRTKIWASMMKGLDEEEYIRLGKKYEFSGGQIENIVRKSAVDYILTGNSPSMAIINRFAEEEQFKSNVKSVGF